MFIQDRHYTFKSENCNDIVDTVGAGDAYAAILTTGYLLHWEPEKILTIATEFSRRICKIPGAIPSSLDFYDDFRLGSTGGFY